MAGRPGNAAEIVRLEKELSEVRIQREKYRKIIISVDPALLDQERSPALEDYDEAIHARIFAMADMGMGEEQWVGEFGLSRKQWGLWKNQYPELIEVVDKALSRALGWWQERARLAQERGNTKFPLSVYNKRTAEIRDAMIEIAGSDGLGDANSLVLLDVRGDAGGFQGDDDGKVAA